MKTDSGASLKWRDDIVLLEEAARATCGRCSTGYPLVSTSVHQVGQDIYVHCSAVMISILMRHKMREARTS